MFRNRRRSWLIRRIALGLTAAAIAAPVAQAKVGEQAWPGVNPTDSAVTSVKASDYHMLRPSPHDPALARGENGSDARKPHRLGGALAREDSQASWSFIASILGDQRPATEATRFDWGDAGIGAGVGFGLVLLGGSALLVTRRVGRTQTA